MIHLTILIITIMISFLFIWLFSYRPYKQIRNKFSYNIVNDILPDIQTSHNLITTLSASAIVLSFTVLKAFNSKPFVASDYLVSSWCLFGASILFGILSGILIYILKAHSSVMIEAFRNLQNESKKGSDEAVNLLKTKIRQQNILFALLVFQSASFISAFVSLILFASENINTIP